MSSGVPPQVLLKRIEKQFHGYLPEDCDHLLNECACLLSVCVVFETHSTIGVKLCQSYDLSAEQLFWKWEAAKRQSRETHRLDSTNLQELKICVAQEQAKPSKPANKNSNARLAGIMSVGSGASGYGPGRIPRQLGGGVMSGMKKEDVERPLPVAGSSKVSFSQVDKVERRECECLAVASPMGTKPVHPQIVTCTRNCQRGVMVSVPPDPKATAIDEISFKKSWTRGSTTWLRSSACTTTYRNFAIQPLLPRYQPPVLRSWPPITIFQEDVVVVGRIVANSETAAASGLSKLDEASIALESSRMMGSGVRVPLRFNTPLKIHGSTRAGFFPGAIVALRGRNGGGGWFSVSEVLSVGGIFHTSPSHSHTKHRSYHV